MMKQYVVRRIVLEETITEVDAILDPFEAAQEAIRLTEGFHYWETKEVYGIEAEPIEEI